MAKSGALDEPLRALVRAATLAASGLLAASPAAAESVCGGLREAIVHAAGGFADLVITGERAGSDYASARNLLPDASRCELRRAVPILEYRCRMTPLDASPAEARSAFRREVRRVRQCFSGNLPRGAGDHTASVDVTGAVIWELRADLRVAVVFVAADEIVVVADSGDDGPEEPNAAYIVVEKRVR